MEIDGRLYPGQIDEKTKASERYEKAKSKGQSAGHVSQRPRSTNKFAVEVNIASQSKVTFNLTYQELLKRKHAAYQHVIYINPSQVVDDFKVDIYIQDSREIRSIFVPDIKKDLPSLEQETALNALVSIERPGSRTAHVNYSPNQQEQTVSSASGIDGLFMVRYDIMREYDVGDVLVVNGYFVHFFAPSGMPPIPKDVLFVLDTSTSMTGTKIRQLREAMLVILNDLHEGDRFNIIEFNTGAQFWKPGELISGNTVNIREAKDHVRNMKPRGWTNVNEAMSFGMDFLNSMHNADNRIQLLLFLADGHPTIGVTDRETILRNARSRNENKVSIYSLAFGNAADYTFVKKLAVQNDGLGRKIYEDSDAAEQIKGFYDEISSAALKNLTFNYLSRDTDVKNLTKSQFNSYFPDSEIVVAGRLPDPHSRMIDIGVNGKGVGGVVDLEMSASVVNNSRVNFPGLTSPMNFEEITEKIWAYITIKQLLEKTLGDVNETLKARFREKALQLALNYRFVTPLTSMVVTKPDDQELGNLEEGQDADLVRGSSSNDGQSAQQPHTQSGGGGGHSHSGGGGGDPHFMIRVDGLSYPVCFDIVCKEGDIMTLLKDPFTGISVKAEIIQALEKTKTGALRTYIGRVYIMTRHFTLDVIPSDIHLNSRRLSWEEERELLLTGGNNVRVIHKEFDQNILRLEIGYDVIINIKRVFMSGPALVDYLNVYIEKEDGLSQKADGVLGQFHRKQIKLKKIRVNSKGQVIGRLLVKDGRKRFSMKTRLHDRKDVISGLPEKCWNAHRHTQGLVTGSFLSKSLLGPKIS